MLQTSINTGNELLEYLVESGEAFEFHTTNNTQTIIYQGIKHIISDRIISKKELSFIQKVKKYAERLNLEIPQTRAKDILYFKGNSNVKRGIYSDIVEIDINSAYWHIAYKLKIISKELFEQGINDKQISKTARLVALGSLATKKNILYFDGKEMQYIKTEKNEITRNYFFYISKTLDNLMLELSEKMGADFLFYWVDALFVTTDRIDFVENFFDQHKMKVKLKYIEKVQILKSKELTQAVCFLPDGNTKKFTININSNLARKKSKQEFFNNFKNI